MPPETDAEYRVDRSALRALTDTYWTTDGWRGDVPPPPEAALAAGIMFAEPWVAGHDEVVETARAAAAGLDRTEVAEAFLAGLTSRRLDLRSALGSYAVARHLPAHAFQPGVDDHRCDICGLIADDRPIDRNVLNFERFKWGGVRRDDLEYVAFDLVQFARAPRLEPGPADLDLGRALIEAIRALPPRTTAAKAVAALKVLPGGRDERGSVLEILSVCGILRTGSRPGYAEAFVPYAARAQQAELCYPLCWWRASDGVSDAELQTVLPSLMS